MYPGRTAVAHVRKDDSSLHYFVMINTMRESWSTRDLLLDEYRKRGTMETRLG